MRIYIEYRPEWVYSKYPFEVLITEPEIELIERIENKESIIQITEEKFKEIYDKFLNLNFKEMLILNPHGGGHDGNDLKINIGSQLFNINIEIWTINYETEERGLIELYDLILEIFALCGKENVFKE